MLEKQPTFLLKSLLALQTLLKPAFETHLDSPKMITALSAFISAATPKLDKTAAANPMIPGAQPNTPAQPVHGTWAADVQAFVRHMSELIGAGLQSSSHSQPRDVSHLHGCLQLLSALASVRTEHLPPSPVISHHLPPSPSISLHLPPSPYTSHHLPPSPSISLHLPTCMQVRPELLAEHLAALGKLVARLQKDPSSRHLPPSTQCMHAAPTHI